MQYAVVQNAGMNILLSYMICYLYETEQGQRRISYTIAKNETKYNDVAMCAFL